MHCANLAFSLPKTKSSPLIDLARIGLTIQANSTYPLFATKSYYKFSY